MKPMIFGKKSPKPFWIHPPTNRTWQFKSDIPKHLIPECEHWGSLLEYECYSIIRKYFDTVERQYEILVLPRTSRFHEWTWKVDFKAGDFFIEVKGAWIKNSSAEAYAFSRMLQTLEYVNESILTNLILIGSNNDGIFQIPNTNNLICYPINQLQECLDQKRSK